MQIISGAPSTVTGSGMRITLGTGSPARRSALIHCISPSITSRGFRSGQFTRRICRIAIDDFGYATLNTALLRRLISSNTP